MSFSMQTFSRVIVLLFLLTVPESCSLFRTFDEIQLIWPPDGIPVFEADRAELWDVVWLSSDGSVRGKRVSGRSSPCITVPREIPLIVAAFPVMDKSEVPFQIRPAGCALSAGSPRSPAIILSWEGGFSASFFLTLAESGVDPGAVNIRRFTEAVHRRCGGNPWSLDLRKLNSELIEGRLWVYSFRLLPAPGVSFSLPAGFWHGEYPPDSVMESISGTWSGKLTVGLHHLIRERDGKVLSVSVDERGEVVTFSEN